MSEILHFPEQHRAVRSPRARSTSVEQYDAHLLINALLDRIFAHPDQDDALQGVLLALLRVAQTLDNPYRGERLQ